jgi:DNA-binding transcriptional ArsR family regulator
MRRRDGAADDMSVHVISWALREAPVTAKGDLLVLIVLADHAHDDGDGAYPSVQTIAMLARLSIRGVQNALRKLESAGLVEAKPRTGRTTTYRVLTPTAVAAGVLPLRPAAVSGGERNQRPKPPQPLRPKRHEPSHNRENDFSHLV